MRPGFRPAGSGVDEINGTGIKTVDGIDDPEFSTLHKAADDGALDTDFLRSAAGILPNGIFKEVAFLVHHCNGRRHDGLQHFTHGARQCVSAARDIAGSLHGAALLVAHNHNQRRSKMFGGIFDAAQRRDVGGVAGIAADEQLAEAQAAKKQFRRNTAVGAGQDRRPGRLA